MAIQLNPTINDAFETKTLAQLRRMVFDGLGFIQPNNIAVFTTRTLLDLRTDIKNRLGLATPIIVVTDTLLNIRTDLYNMLGFAAMATHPPGVDTMLNAFINQAQQFLHRTLELDRGITPVPAVLSADGSICVLDRDAILRIALGNAKSRWRQADAQIYLAEAKKYIDDLKGRAPPNIDGIINNALVDAERMVANSIEFSDLWVAGAAPTVGLLPTSDNSRTTCDAEPVFLLALANLKASMKQDDAKAIGSQFENYIKDMAQRQPPNAKTTVNRILKDAQQYLYRAYDVFRMERWFTWTTVAGTRFYGVNADDGSAISPPTGVVAVAGAPSTAGNLTTGRVTPSVSLLNTGSVLIAGGRNASGQFASAELYTPSTGAFSLTGSMNQARNLAGIVALPNGKILICGGFSEFVLATAEIYDPVSGTFSPTGSMNFERCGHSCTLLQNGKVLIAGGKNDSAVLSSSEIFDPFTNAFTTSGAMGTARTFHPATVLSNGKVLISGGTTSMNGLGCTAVAEIYDPVAGTFSATGVMGSTRQLHTSTLLANGTVLIAGGVNAGLATVATAEIYGSAGTFTATTGNMTTTRSQHTASLLPNGKVLIAGDGQNGTTADTYNPLTGTFTATSNAMTSIGGNTTSILLGNGLVLIAGGGLLSSSAFLSSAMLYNQTTNTFAVTGSLTQGTNFYKVYATTATGYTLVGGITTPVSPGTTLPSAEATVAGIGAATSVNVSWNPIINSTITGYVVCRSKTTNTELVLATVDPTVTSYTDLGTITPSGALPTANTTGNIGNLDARAVTFVGASSGDNTWRELIEGVDPLQYNGTWTGPPQRYEIRQAIELWPTPADSTWLLRIKGYFAPLPFEADTDTTSIDWQAVYFKALADALRFFKRPDDARAEDAKLMDYVKRLVAGTHKTARYISGNIPIRNTPPRPVIV